MEYSTLLASEKLTNMERKAIKIDIMRNLPRVRFNNGAIMVTGENGEVGVFYSYSTGIIHRAVKNRLTGNWSYSGAECRCNSTSNYKWVELPKTQRFTGKVKGLIVGAHVIAGVLLGYYDHIDIDMIMVYDLNHKDWNCTNNKPDNMEVVTKGDNTNHRTLKALLIEDKSFVDGMTFSAVEVTEAMKKADGDIAMLKRLLNITDSTVELV